MKSVIQNLYWNNVGVGADPRIDGILEVLFYLIDPCRTSTLLKRREEYVSKESLQRAKIDKEIIGFDKIVVGSPDPIEKLQEKVSELHRQAATKDEPAIYNYYDLVEEVRKTKNALEHEKKWSAMFRDRATKAEQTIFDVRKLVE